MTRFISLKGAVAGAFGAAAETYHSAADVQREVASRLARRIAGLDLRTHPRILEIGCGTGFLYRALASDLREARWLLTDLSEAMVLRARAEIADDKVGFAVMDGERPALGAGQFDLICASLAFQWFEDLPASLRNLVALLAPGGVLAFSTLTADSFPEWREAHQEIGVRPAMRSYPTREQIERMVGARGSVETTAIPRRYRSAHAFLTHWKEIGTHVPAPNRTPLPAGTMRKLLQRFESGILVTYDVAYSTVRKIEVPLA